MKKLKMYFKEEKKSMYLIANKIKAHLHLAQVIPVEKK